MPIEHHPRRVTMPEPRLTRHACRRCRGHEPHRHAGHPGGGVRRGAGGASLPDVRARPLHLPQGAGAHLRRRARRALLCLASARRLTVFMVDALLAGFLAISHALGAARHQRLARVPRAGREPRGRGAVLVRPHRGARRPGRGAARGPRGGGGAGGADGPGPGLRARDDQPRQPEPGAGRHLRQPELHGAPGGHRPAGAALPRRRGPVAPRFLLGGRRRRPRGRRAGALALPRRAGSAPPRRALFLVVEGLWLGRLWDDDRLRRRVLQLAAVAVAGAGARAGAAEPAQLAVRLALSRVARPAWPTTRKAAGAGGSSSTATRSRWPRTIRCSASVRATGRSTIRATCRPAIRRSTPTTSSRPTPGPAATGWRWPRSAASWRSALLALVGVLDRAGRVGARPPRPAAGARADRPRDRRDAPRRRRGRRVRRGAAAARARRSSRGPSSARWPRPRGRFARSRSPRSAGAVS